MVRRIKAFKEGTGRGKRMNYSPLRKNTCIFSLSLLLLTVPFNNGAVTMENSFKGLKLRYSKSFQDYTVRIYMNEEEGDDYRKW